MGLLSHKPKVSAEEFCRDFYDSLILHPIIAGADASVAFCETVLKAVKEADPSFAAGNSAAFWREITALRIELFGLAWVHHLIRDKKCLLRQIAFTKRYLEDNKQSEIWDAMADYNHAISQSSFHAPAGEWARRANFAFLVRFRTGLFEKWEKEGGDPWCAARVANLVGTDAAWKSGVTQPFVIHVLVKRLGLQLNEEGRRRLATVASGLYQGAKDSIKSVHFL